MDLLEKLAGIEKRYDELNVLMTDPAVIADYNRLRETGQERTSLEPIVHAYHEYRAALRHLDEAQSLAAGEADTDLKTMAEEEAAQLHEQIAQMENHIRVLLVPKDPRDDRN